MGHIANPEAEAILEKEFKVLNHGFIRLVDYMGGDERIVQAARVSYGKGTKSRRQDRGLINYLMRNRHTSPFEQVILTFHVKLPIFVARQWIRHRTARLNEMSGRYSVMDEQFYVPEPAQIRRQATDNKQGRGEEMPVELQGHFLEMLKGEQESVYKNYTETIDIDIARELARINLPLSLYTQWYWQIDLHNLFHFLKLRMDPHAQYEIRVYAKIMAEMVKKVAPLAYEAFEEHTLDARTLPGSTVEQLKPLLEKLKSDEAKAILDQLQ